MDCSWPKAETDDTKTDLTFKAPGEIKQLKVSAVLNYQKADAAFLDKLFGVEAGIRSRITAMSTAELVIGVER